LSVNTSLTVLLQFEKELKEVNLFFVFVVVFFAF